MGGVLDYVGGVLDSVGGALDSVGGTQGATASSADWSGLIATTNKKRSLSRSYTKNVR